MAIDNVALNIALTALETGVLPASFPASQAQSVTHNQFNKSKSLSASTTPAVTKIAYFTVTLTAGAATIDLTALPHNGGTVDGTGLKVQAMLFRNEPANSAVTISDGASNGYNIFGDASGQVTLPAHATEACYVMLYAPEGLQDIAAGDRTIDLAGTGTESFDVAIIMG